MKIFLTAMLIVFALNCKSAGEERQEMVNSCSNICKSNPEIGEFTHEEGGGIIFLGGYKKEKCACSRSSKM